MDIIHEIDHNNDSNGNNDFDNNDTDNGHTTAKNDLLEETNEGVLEQHRNLLHYRFNYNDCHTQLISENSENKAPYLFIDAHAIEALTSLPEASSSLSATSSGTYDQNNHCNHPPHTEKTISQTHKRSRSESDAHQLPYDTTHHANNVSTLTDTSLFIAPKHFCYSNRTFGHANINPADDRPKMINASTTKNTDKHCKDGSVNKKNINYCENNSDPRDNGTRGKKRDRIEFQQIMARHTLHLNEKKEPKYMSDEDLKFCMKHIDMTFNEKAVKVLDIDIDDNMVPGEIKLILALGPKFALPLPISPNNAKQLLEAIGALNQFQLAVYECRTLCAMAKSYMTDIGHITSRKEANLQMFMTHAYNCTLRFFYEHNNLMFAQADKGNVTVILQKDAYINKMNALLLNRSTYTPINVSAHNSFNTINERLLHRLSSLGFVKSAAITTILANEQNIANMYGLIKIHKDDAPLRPIVNTRSTPGYTIAKIIYAILAPARDTEKYNVINTAHLLQKLTYVDMGPSDSFVTIDIRDMFTNISTEMAIASVTKTLSSPKDQQRNTSGIDHRMYQICHTNSY